MIAEFFVSFLQKNVDNDKNFGIYDEHKMILYDLRVEVCPPIHA
jgi:hypothetical protein